MTTSASAELFLSYIPKDDGTVNAFGIVKTYAAGTTTPKATYPTYADALAGTNANATTITLDATGVIYFWMQGSYKIDVQTAGGVSLAGWPKDNIQGAYLTQGAADLVYSAINKPIQLLTSTYNAGTGVYSISPTPAITAYENGQRFMFVANTTNTYASTHLNVSNIGSKPIVDWTGGDLVIQNTISQSQIVEIVYLASDEVFRMISPPPIYRFIKSVGSTTFTPGSDGVGQMIAVTTGSYPGMFFRLIYAPDPAYGEWQTVAWGAGTKTYVRAEHATTGTITLKQKVVTDTTGAGVDSSLTIVSAYQVCNPT